MSGQQDSIRIPLIWCAYRTGPREPLPIFSESVAPVIPRPSQNPEISQRQPWQPSPHEGRHEGRLRFPLDTAHGYPPYSPQAATCRVQRPGGRTPRNRSLATCSEPNRCEADPLGGRHRSQSHWHRRVPVMSGERPWNRSLSREDHSHGSKRNHPHDHSAHQ